MFTTFVFQKTRELQLRILHEKYFSYIELYKIFLHDHVSIHLNAINKTTFEINTKQKMMY